MKAKVRQENKWASVMLWKSQMTVIKPTFVVHPLEVREIRTHLSRRSSISTTPTNMDPTKM